MLVTENLRRSSFVDLLLELHKDTVEVSCSEDLANGTYCRVCERIVPSSSGSRRAHPLGPTASLDRGSTSKGLGDLLAFGNIQSDFLLANDAVFLQEFSGFARSHSSANGFSIYPTKSAAR